MSNATAADGIRNGYGDTVMVMVTVMGRFTVTRCVASRTRSSYDGYHIVCIKLWIMLRFNPNLTSTGWARHGCHGKT